MIYIIVGMSLLFFGIGYLVTEKNAKNVLAGYNTMSEAEREKVDIQAFVPFFRRFHIYLALSFLVLGLLLHFLIGEMASGLFIGIYPILAYIYMMMESRKFHPGQSGKPLRIGLMVLGFSLLVILGIFAVGLWESKMVVKETAVEITGMYGEEIAVDDIAIIRLVDELPEITWKVNGFALGAVSKGWFKTGEDEKVKLLLNNEKPPFILFEKKSGERIYFTGDETERLYEEIKSMTPNSATE